MNNQLTFSQRAEISRTIDQFVTDIPGFNPADYEPKPKNEDEQKFMDLINRICEVSDNYEYYTANDYVTAVEELKNLQLQNVSLDEQKYLKEFVDYLDLIAAASR